MPYSFLNTSADMKWLRDVHLPGLPAKFKSALIKGNEDYPDEIEVYYKKDPNVDDAKVRFKLKESADGKVYQPISCRTCDGSGQRSTARSARGSELERHEKRGTPCGSCGGYGR